MKYDMVSVIVTLLTICHSNGAIHLNCCMPPYSSDGIDCLQQYSTHAKKTNSTQYVCKPVTRACGICMVDDNNLLESGVCDSCCVPKKEEIECEDIEKDFFWISTGSWTIICMIAFSSCCCCAILFLSTENNFKDGFSDAHFLPIPVVTPNISFDEDDFKGQIVVARTHGSIDVPIAEPAENSYLLGRGGGTRGRWNA